jgi:hypothetical protein
MPTVTNSTFDASKVRRNMNSTPDTPKVQKTTNSTPDALSRTGQKTVAAVWGTKLPRKVLTNEY